MPVRCGVEKTEVGVMAFGKKKRNDHKAVPEAWGLAHDILGEGSELEGWSSKGVVSLGGLLFSS